MPRQKTTKTTKSKKTASLSSSPAEARSTSITKLIEKLGQSSRLRSRLRDQEEGGSSESREEERPSTSSVVRKKRKGLSVRNGEQVDTRQQNRQKGSTKEGNMSKQQSKRKRTQPPSASRGNQSKRQKDKEEDEQYTERTVSAQAASRWKPLSKASRQFVLDTLDGAIVNVLNEANPSSYDDVQDRLNILRQRIVGTLPGIVVPSARQPDYRHIEERCHEIEVSVAEASNQVESLEKEIDRQLRQNEEKEQLLEDMKTTSETQNNRRINPILQSTSGDSLGLPAVKGSKPQSKASPSSTQHHKNLVDVLKKWQSQETVKDMGTFMDTLSTVTSTL